MTTMTCPQKILTKARTDPCRTLPAGCRLAKGLTQAQLASAVGVRRETIMRLEKAQYNPSLKLAVDISRTVEAPIEEIFIFE